VDTSKLEVLWILRAQCDDREALELLLRHVQPSLHRYIAGIVGPTDADDVLQDVLVILFRKLAWLENPELFRPWAFRIASRAAFRHLKREKKWGAGDDVVLENIPAPDVSLSDQLLPQLEDNDAISPASRAVLVLHFREGLSLPDVAAVLELPLGTVKSRLAYGLAILRRWLGMKKGQSNVAGNRNSSP
jgi:RNA polymerase sigma-70 factor (ECF subfamily)